MDSQDRQQSQLNQSKFLSQQINLDEIPTQQQIIQRAQQLDIDDLILAKESLLKELSQQWKPYINRQNHIYYINLQEQKAYIDHPIDMEIKITYAIKNNKRIPGFKEFKITEVSEDPARIYEEIRKYKRSHKLNIVYEESQEQSIRKQTKRSQQNEYEVDHNHTNHQLNEEIARYARQLKLSLEKQLNSYKKSKQNQLQSRERQHKQIMKEIKKIRLQVLSQQIQKDWITKNQYSFNRSLQNVRDQFQNKRIRLQNLYDQEYEVLVKMQNFNEVGTQIRSFHREKVINTKKALLVKLQRDLHIQYRTKIANHLNQASRQFNKNCQQFTSSKINYKWVLEQGFQAFGRQVKVNMDETRPKRKHSIFGLDLSKGKQKVEQKLKELNVNEPVWCNKQQIVRDVQYCKYLNKPSLPLRLMKKIL